MNIEILRNAKDKLLKFRLHKKDNPLLESIDTQIDYLIQVLEKTNLDRTKLGDITIGVIAVREIEGIDDDLAELIYEINFWVDNVLMKD